VSALRRLVLASHNPSKLAEMRALLAPLAIEVLEQGALGIAEAEEPHATFLENALAKARHASRAARQPALADDSGLCVAALGGAPGVHSAHYAGRDGSRAERDARNNARLLGEVAGLADRRAEFVCVMVLVRSPGDPRPLVAEGVWPGEVALAPRGANGFGYDPLFWLRERGCTAAELRAEEKSRLSHRARAAARLIERLAGEA
jgi:XTP/dITP diphosphohydrolase